MLWEGLRSPTIQALFELTNAARTRLALRAHLATAAPAHLAAMVTFSRHPFPEVAGNPHFDGTVGVVPTSLPGDRILVARLRRDLRRRDDQSRAGADRRATGR